MMQWSRREFLAGSRNLGLALAAQGFGGRAWSDPLGLPIGIQLWTVNAPLMADPARTLSALRHLGFRVVETAGFGKATAKEFRGLIDGADLKCPSAHLDFMNGDVDAVLADANALGVHYAVAAVLRLGTGELPATDPPIPGFLGKLKPMTLEDARVTAALANKIGEKARRAGLQFVYHNHYFEFVDQGGGAIAYDVLLKETDPSLVQFEIDCGWMEAAGHHPADYFRRDASRFPLIHVKDYAVPPNGTRVLPALRVGAPVGQGAFDYKSIFAAAGRGGKLKYYFAEQEPPFVGMTELEAAKITFDYLHSLP